MIIGQAISETTGIYALVVALILIFIGADNLMISINPYEIILQIINFGILYFLLRRFLAKPLSSLLSNRANMIKHNIESAELNKRKGGRAFK